MANGKQKQPLNMIINNTNRDQRDPVSFPSLLLSFILCASVTAVGQTAQNGHGGQSGSVSQQTQTPARPAVRQSKTTSPNSEKKVRLRSATIPAGFSALANKSFRVVVPSLTGTRLEGFYDYSYRINMPTDMYL